MAVRFQCALNILLKLHSFAAPGAQYPQNEVPPGQFIPGGIPSVPTVPTVPSVSIPPSGNYQVPPNIFPQTPTSYPQRPQPGMFFI